MVEVIRALLVFLRLILFGLALGMTIISFQAYTRKQTERLQFAFIGFAFISMGVALTNMTVQVAPNRPVFQVAETIPFIIGFSMLYVSLYR